MSVKHVLLIVLVMVNLLLVTALVLELTAPRPAQAQGVGGGFNYAVVTAKLRGGEDALWILDWRARRLAVLRLPQGNNFNMIPVGAPRDLQRDFRAAGGGR